MSLNLIKDFINPNVIFISFVKVQFSPKWLHMILFSILCSSAQRVWQVEELGVPAQSLPSSSASPQDEGGRYHQNLH